MPNVGAPGTEIGAAGVPLGESALLDVDRRRRTGVPGVVFSAKARRPSRSSRH